MDQPRLIENSVKNYLYQTLQNCHSNRTNIYSYALNLGILVIFFGVVGMVLYNSYKNKLSPYELHQKMIRDQEYVLSKIKYYQEDRKNQQQTQMSSITNLPYLES
jgi:hypothetical protein